MRKLLLSPHICLLIVLVLVMVGCSPAATPAAPVPTNTPVPASAPTNTPEAASPATATEQTVADQPTATADQGQPTTAPVNNGNGNSNGQILAWVAPAAAPGQQESDQSGELVLFSADGGRSSILTLPASTTRVTACGAGATSPDGRIFAFMTTVTAGGGEAAALHLMRDSNPAIETVAEDLNPIACVGSSGFAFSPDGSRFAFVDWPEEANNADSPVGRLLIYTTAGAGQVANLENVTDFVLTADGAAFASFFLDSDNQATEVGIFTWDGENEREVATVRAEEDCYYTSASLTPVVNNQLAGILGYRCSGGSTQWQLHLIDPAARTSQLEMTEATGGRYFGFSDTNAAFTSPDGSILWFTVPDGVSNQTVSLMATSVNNIAPTTVVERYGVMPTVSDLPYDASNATATLSPDGRFLAIVVNEGTNDAVLNVVDLSDPSIPPVQVDAGDRGDTIGSMAFSADSSQLFFVAGPDEGANNALLALNLATGQESRIARGRFAQIVAAPDGSRIAAMNWEEFDPEEPRYLKLSIVDTASGEETVIFEGGEVNADGQLINPAFAYPLSWRNS